jgi:hypothetical protein
MGRKSLYQGKKTTPVSYRIAINYNSKKNAWGGVDKLFYDINLLLINL